MSVFSIVGAYKYTKTLSVRFISLWSLMKYWVILTRWYETASGTAITIERAQTNAIMMVILWVVFSCLSFIVCEMTSTRSILSIVSVKMLTPESTNTWTHTPTYNTRSPIHIRRGGKKVLLATCCSCLVIPLWAWTVNRWWTWTMKRACVGKQLQYWRFLPNIM